MGITHEALRRNAPLCYSALLALFSFGIHLVPFFLSGPHPLGYDTGFYRRYLIQPLVSFPNTPVPGLGIEAPVPRVILDLLRALHVSPDLALYGSYLLFWSALPILLFYWLKPFLGNRNAFIGGLLLVLSPVGYTAYWFMLYKNAFALCLLLFAFISFERRWFWTLVVLDLAIPLSHKTTAVIYVGTLAVLLVLARERWKEIGVHTTIAGLCFLAMNAATAVAVVKSGAIGVFVSSPDYITLSIPFALAALCAIPRRKELARHQTLLAFALASFAFPLLSLAFYQRIFVFTDVALTALAAYGIAFLVSNMTFEAGRSSPYVYFGVLCVVTGTLVGSLETQIKNLSALETSPKLTHISAVGMQIPANGLLLTTTDEAPWYEGWTTAHIAAAGMLHDTHSLEAWTAFWNATSSDEKIAFLNTFPQPLYISTLGDVTEFIGTLPPCLTQIRENLWRNDCVEGGVGQE